MFNFFNNHLTYMKRSKYPIHAFYIFVNVYFCLIDAPIKRVYVINIDQFKLIINFHFDPLVCIYPDTVPISSTCAHSILYRGSAHSRLLGPGQPSQFIYLILNLFW